MQTNRPNPMSLSLTKLSIVRSMEKVSFTLTSKPSSTKPCSQNKSSSCITYITEFDRRKPIPNPNAKKPKIIPPISNAWIKTLADIKLQKLNLSLDKKPKNLTGGLNLHKERKHSNADRFQLNLRSNKGGRFESGYSRSEDKNFKRLKNDLEELPDDKGMIEFDDMPVEDFTAALGKRYGWNVNIDNDDKEDHPIKKMDRSGLGYAEYEAKEKAAKDEVAKINLRNDLEKLPDDRGFDEFEGMPVDGFAAALLKGYGWNGVLSKNYKKEHPFKTVYPYKKRKGLGFIEHEAKINAAKEEVKVVKRKRSREEEEWLVSGIRVRFISKELKDGSLFSREGVVFDVAGLGGTCDVVMDDTREIIQGVEPEFLDTVLPLVGRWVVVLLGTYKGTFGTLIRKDMECETALVLHANTNEVFHVKFEHIAEYVDDDIDHHIELNTDL